ncbi:P-loop containing nucleoside triphosphate hydrolase protein [Aspergillus minisclerotigenes]|uniref:P-loop containing nucleoside triphosphate hydrolase protein n=1 Tax=Aspergillus minisclerotigenes TaxID=656917 RepID=A0A5N6JCZ4_9EURO|nr:P-loop containing nucleoside triphosphate hydrolase protein [Aspergillus minisclerotigenes]
MTSPKVYPIRFSRNVKKVMEDENEVGRGFMQTCDSKLLAHPGWAFVPEQNETNFVFVSGNVVIDFEETFKAHPDWKPVRKLPSTRYRRGQDLHLLPSRLFGYSLHDRRFVALDVRNLRRIEGSRDMFKNLIINPHHEAILRALVESHFIRKEINDTRGIATTNQDIVQNKGRGLVILLHGVPGVGKTSTAETIASHLQKPLLPITCGDLRLDPAAVEKSLKELFRVAQLWDCILLLDEADVFLSERVSSDLSRNALVSAFKSRIHISLYYPYLDPGQTEKIWEVNLDRLAATEEEHDGGRKPLSIDRDGILAFAKKHFTKSENGKGKWNGRQIRNAFLIASALAHYERTRGIKKGGKPYDLNGRHFKTVVKAGTGFEKYVLETRDIQIKRQHILTLPGVITFSHKRL